MEGKYLETIIMAVQKNQQTKKKKQKKKKNRNFAYLGSENNKNRHTIVLYILAAVNVW